jgi:hypothetical protein
MKNISEITKSNVINHLSTVSRKNEPKSIGTVECILSVDDDDYVSVLWYNNDTLYSTKEWVLIDDLNILKY